MRVSSTMLLVEFDLFVGLFFFGGGCSVILFVLWVSSRLVTLFSLMFLLVWSLLMSDLEWYLRNSCLFVRLKWGDMLLESAFSDGLFLILTKKNISFFDLSSF